METDNPKMAGQRTFPQSDMLDKLEEIMTSKLESFKQEINETQRAISDVQLSKMSEISPYQFKKKGNEEQFKVNAMIDHKLQEAQSALQENPSHNVYTERASTKIAEGMDILKHRQKCIRKDHVRHENISQRLRWPARWGYLINEYESMSSQLKGLQTQVCRPRSPYCRFQTNKLPPINKPKGRQLDFPVTTTQEIGWKVSKPGHHLEKYGPDTRGRSGILRLLRWPQESAP